jgi:hypothetical protein
MSRSLCLALLLVACGDKDADDTGVGGVDGGDGTAENCGCVRGTEQPLALDEVAPNGIAAQELLDIALGSHGSTLVWSGGAGVTNLLVELSVPSNARFVPQSEGQCSNDIAYDCPDLVEVDVSARFVTSDNALNETATLTLTDAEWAFEARDPSRVSFTWPFDSISGSFDPADYVDVSGYDRVDVWAEITIAGTDLSGAVAGGGESTSGSGDEGSVSYSALSFGTF